MQSEVNKYWNTVFNTIHDGIMIVDKTGTMVEVNRAFEAMTGYSRLELIGQPCTILNCGECEIAQEAGKQNWCLLFETGKLEMNRCMIRNKRGEVLPVIKNASLLIDDQGIIIGAVETLTDISEIVIKEREIDYLREQLRSNGDFFGILGTSPKMRMLFDLIANASKSDAPVIISGETGTGKELVAEAVHKMRGEGERPFVKVNCAALSESLLESELFGHVKGAFTGAYRSRTGRFEAAHTGDIFLDEIGDLPLSTQVKLLRVLEDTVIERVGDSRPIQVDVRIITATNRDLEELVRQGGFRKDLYYRINVIPIHVPPLRERSEDIPTLVDYFMSRRNRESETTAKRISASALDALLTYSWPGNVRELKSTVEYMCVTCAESVIKAHHLPRRISGISLMDEAGSFPVRKKDSDARKELIKALEQSGGNRAETARILGVSRVTVWNRMKKYGI